MRSPISGLIVIAFLWVLILITIIKFWSVNRNAALLLVPLYRLGEHCCILELLHLEIESLRANHDSRHQVLLSHSRSLLWQWLLED
ncbi:MAG: tryptophan-rich sensory protein [Methanotrichaceae archaeon]